MNAVNALLQSSCDESIDAIMIACWFIGTVFVCTVISRLKWGTGEKFRKSESCCMGEASIFRFSFLGFLWCECHFINPPPNRVNSFMQSLQWWLTLSYLEVFADIQQNRHCYSKWTAKVRMNQCWRNVGAVKVLFWVFSARKIRFVYLNSINLFYLHKTCIFLYVPISFQLCIWRSSNSYCWIPPGRAHKASWINLIKETSVRFLFGAVYYHSDIDDIESKMSRPLKLLLRNL